MSFDPMNLYYEKWLPRARKLLAPSGLFSELVLVVARKKGLPQEQVRLRFRNVLDGKEQPDADLVFEVETFLSRVRTSKAVKAGNAEQIGMAL